MIWHHLTTSFGTVGQWGAPAPGNGGLETTSPSTQRHRALCRTSHLPPPQLWRSWWCYVPQGVALWAYVTDSVAADSCDTTLRRRTSAIYSVIPSNANVRRLRTVCSRTHQVFRRLSVDISVRPTGMDLGASGKPVSGIYAKQYSRP